MNLVDTQSRRGSDGNRLDPIEPTDLKCLRYVAVHRGHVHANCSAHMGRERLH